MSKYYVLTKSLWQGDRYSPVAGPFGDYDEAQKVAEEKADNGFKGGQQNLKQVRNAVICNTTQMRQRYGITRDQALESIARVMDNQSFG